MLVHPKLLVRATVMAATDTRDPSSWRTDDRHEVCVHDATDREQVSLLWLPPGDAPEFPAGDAGTEICPKTGHLTGPAT